MCLNREPLCAADHAIGLAIQFIPRSVIFISNPIGLWMCITNMSEIMRLNRQMIEFWCIWYLNCPVLAGAGNNWAKARLSRLCWFRWFQFILYDFSCMTVLADIRCFTLKCIEGLKTQFVVEKPVRVTTPKVLS